MMHLDTVKKTGGAIKGLDVVRHHTTVVIVLAWFRRPFVQRLLLLVALTLLAMSFGMWFLSSSHTSFAKSTSFETCATALAKDKAKFCTGADPVSGGCSLDAQTVTQQPVMLDGQTVGMAEVRYSQSCNTYWARGFSNLTGKSVSVYVSALGTSDTASFLSTSSEAYSNMVYASIPTIVVQIDVSPSQVASATIAGVN